MWKYNISENHAENSMRLFNTEYDMDGTFNLWYEELTDDWNIEYRDDDGWIIASGKTKEEVLNQWVDRVLKDKV